MEHRKEINAGLAKITNGANGKLEEVLRLFVISAS